MAHGHPIRTPVSHSSAFNNSPPTLRALSIRRCESAKHAQKMGAVWSLPRQHSVTGVAAVALATAGAIGLGVGVGEQPAATTLVERPQQSARQTFGVDRARVLETLVTATTSAPSDTGGLTLLPPETSIPPGLGGDSDPPPTPADEPTPTDEAVATVNDLLSEVTVPQVGPGGPRTTSKPRSANQAALGP
jgi:hypothetical protein